MHIDSCPIGPLPGICLSASLCNVSDVLDWSPTSVPAAWASQGEQVEWKTESSEKAQLSEMWHQVLQWCQTLCVPLILPDLWLSCRPVFVGICFEALPALPPDPAWKAACMCFCFKLRSTALSLKISSAKGKLGLEQKSRRFQVWVWMWVWSPGWNSGLFILHLTLRCCKKTRMHFSTDI